MSGSSQPSEAGGSDLAASAAGESGAPAPAGGSRPRRLRRLLGRREPRGADPLAPTPPADTGMSTGDEPAAPADPIAEMRRDIAALWLAFSHQERTLRELKARLDGSPVAEPAPTAEEPATAAEATTPPGEGGPVAEQPPLHDQSGVPISEQLSDLDDVLASIERATEVLELTHADEIEGSASHEPSGTEPTGDDSDDDPVGPQAPPG